MFFKKNNEVKAEEEKKIYEISIAKITTMGNKAPTLTVTIDHLTINSDFETHAKQFKNGSVYGVNFTLKDINTLMISITPDSTFDSGDKLFRESLGLVNRYKLPSTDLAKIISAYENYLQDHTLESSYVTKTTKYVHQKQSGSAY